LLRGDPYLNRDFDWDEVIRLAQSSRGRDENGWRNEFIQLARRAERAPPQREEREPLDG
jgi:Ca-activated chloride channel family protein